MVTQTYNGHGLPYGLTTDAPQALVSSTLYNQLGGIREINLNNGLRTLFNYHGLDAVDNADPANHWGRLYRIETLPQAGGTALQHQEYWWDGNGNLEVREDEAAAETERFSYDNLDRLAGVSGPYTESFTYDVLGNITAMNGTGYAYTKSASIGTYPALGVSSKSIFTARGFMIKDTLAESLAKAVSEAEGKGRLIKSALPEITVDHAQRPEHGDYCSSLPLKLARGQGMPPLEIAKRLVEHLPQMPEVEKVTLAAPGFINFILSQRWLAGQVNEIIGAGERYGESSIGAGTSVQVEFVSVNPTGPLHVGHGRGAVLGSALASVLRTSGHAVTTEYYINDAGSQIEAFHRSLFARYQQHFGGTAEMPSSGYMGTYMVDLANGLANEYGRKFLDMPAEAAVAEIGEIGISRMIAKIKEDLVVLGVSFDVWFREKSLFESGLYNKVIVLLDERGYVSRREGATWFVSTALGESKDNVLVRSDGTPTYFASDIAYHYNKFVERGFDKVIDIWGADHQGHVSRIKAAASALGTDPGRLTVLITQMVALRRGDELVKISKRSGELITLKELIEEVGADACRFFFLSRSADAQMDFDIELAKKQSAENPVYYVQYAHARISSILRFAKEKGVKAQGGDVSMLNTPQELALVRKMLLFPEVVETVARTFQPHHLPYYATELATAFHDFYTDCRVVSEDECLSGARLKLVQAAKIVLARVLHLMGVTAPEQM